MRTVPLAAIVFATLFVTSAASAQETNAPSVHETHASLQGFGGLGIGSSAGNVHPSFGGTIIGDLTPNVQLLGEVGRIGNMLPSQTQTLINLTPLDLSLSAVYASGGVRLSGGRSAIRPYAEASAGIARLRPQVSGIPGGLPGVLTNITLSMLDRTSPIASLGAGVTLHGGPIVADIGYRNLRVLSSSWMDALALGNSLSTNEVRFGVGVRF